MMSMLTKALVGVAVVAVASILPALGREEMKVGTKAPAFSASASDGKTYTLASLTKDGPVHLYFIKIGCPVNHRAAPFMKKLDGAYKNKSRVVGVINGSAADAKQWAKEYGTKFPILADPDLKIIHSYRADHSPWVVSVGKDGKVTKAISETSSTNLKGLNERVAKGLNSKLVAISFDGAPSGGG